MTISDKSTDPVAEKCNKAAAPFIPRWGMSWACCLSAGHEGECKRGGNCVKHGEYIGDNCPQWPACVNTPVAGPLGTCDKWTTPHNRDSHADAGCVNWKPVAELCEACGQPKDDPRMHFDVPGVNWGAALHYYRAPVAEQASGDNFDGGEPRRVAGSGAQPVQSLVDGCRPDAPSAAMPTPPTLSPTPLPQAAVEGTLRERLRKLTYIVPASCVNPFDKPQTFTITAYSAGSHAPLLTEQQIDAIVSELAAQSPEPSGIDENWSQPVLPQGDAERVRLIIHKFRPEPSAASDTFWLRAKLQAICLHLNISQAPLEETVEAAIAAAEKAAEWAKSHIEERGRQNDELRAKLAEPSAAGTLVVNLESYKELNEAAQDVIDWEAEYRQLNNLGKGRPYAFDRLEAAIQPQPSPTRPPVETEAKRLLDSLGPIIRHAKFSMEHSAQSPSSHQDFIRQDRDDLREFEQARATLLQRLKEAEG